MDFLERFVRRKMSRGRKQQKHAGPLAQLEEARGSKGANARLDGAESECLARHEVGLCEGFFAQTSRGRREQKHAGPLAQLVRAEDS